jgi:hypothetical protein
MNMDEQRKAKKIFFDFACNHYYMQHDGVYDEYKKYNVSEKQEKEWRIEYIDFWVDKLSVDNPLSLSRLIDANAKELIPALVNMSNNGDGFTKYWCAKAILDFSMRSKDFPEKVKDIVRVLLKPLADGVVIILEQNKTKISFTSILLSGTFTPEAYIRKYAKLQLSNLERKIYYE